MKNNKSLTRSYLQPLSFLLISVFLAGCSARPWTGPVIETEADFTIQSIQKLIERDNGCGKALDGDLNLFYKGPLGKRGVSGFLRFSMPSFFNFVVINTLGQPLFIVAGDNKDFQAINTLKYTYINGSLSSFFLLNDIPAFILNDRWGEWITARNNISSQAITNIRQDGESRGVWVTFQHQDRELVQKTHLLLDPTNEFFLARLLEDSAGKIIAEITYGNWVAKGKCKQPLNIDITGLDYGSNISLRLSNIRISNETKKYTISSPPGYTQQFIP